MYSHSSFRYSQFPITNVRFVVLVHDAMHLSSLFKYLFADAHMHTATRGDTLRNNNQIVNRWNALLLVIVVIVRLSALRIS